MSNLTPWILVLPLLGFIALGLFGRYLSRPLIALVGCGTVLLAFLLALLDFAPMLGQPVAGRVNDVTLWRWVDSGTLHISFGLLSDPLSAVMLLIVTGVGFLIHVYSIGYMEDDPGFWRFFAYLNFFVFAMTLLVAVDSFLFLLVGWAGVGLASFLLIGFWYTRPAAVAAAKKAFVVNVIGDVGLMLAIFLLFKTFGALNYVGSNGLLNRPYAGVAQGTLVAITLLLFVACAAKSAQFPLHVWLPDAMEGPTPVSALIHAATMVTAGVYLVARASSLFLAAPPTLGVIGVIAGVSALFAATLACVQTDIKRVLAYSTMSQLAYMFLGEAAGGFTSGIFHLTTHAFFKALLFMSAGAVIHALGGEQDMRRMGGLARRLRFTYLCFVVGGLALAAIFPFAGFWSKDAILGTLLHAAATGAANMQPLWWALYLAGLLTAGLTGFYTFRLIFSVFLGQYRGGEIVPHAEGHGRGAPRVATSGARDPLARVHEVGPAMSVPMAALAVLSLVGGFYDAPFWTGLSDFLAPVVARGGEVSGGAVWLSLGLGLVCALAGIGLAWLRYGARQPRFAPSHNPVVALLEHRYYVDDLYTLVFVRFVGWAGEVFRRAIEGFALDGGSRETGGVISRTSAGLRAFQSGYARNYALLIFLGVAILLIYILALR